MKSLLHLLAVLGCIQFSYSLSAHFSDSDCRFKSGDVTYDFSWVGSNSPGIRKYEVIDGEILPFSASREDPLFDTFYFQLCKRVELVDEDNDENCRDLGPSSVIVKTRNNECRRVGGTSKRVEHLAITDVSKGVVVDFEEGDTCEYNPYGSHCSHGCSSHKTRVEFICADTEESTLYNVNSVDSSGKPSYCEYKITIESMKACPLECGRAMFGDRMALCGGRGVCGIDKSSTDFGIAKCFCEEGWAGSDCSVKIGETNSESGGSSVLSWLMFFMLIGLVVLVVLMSKQIRAYRDDAQVYLHVRGEEMMQQMQTI